ncbi:MULTISPECIES: YiiX/YebB-like N1pC/P60 family cysteine hydrolase [Xanthomonas]|uniref:YiiX/YebB-like N1pC/P60 family cysteine hydrolase n=1 Tax=Xanthomonas dyei TaxID=743699 RepID=A0ABZ0DE05_9XANT|nr:YiiX/YebB-like N1pC/P60 family cysteine hydrolase [Xanthomonas dyei]WOB28508.1 YiiX/YebB-like N1pC/P60 family cysteine hydrolase [Xanthomonas dyei]WOB56128.1 YiiX/YebB-like N1pC/P60 family cysteine hydrolase [Xanthomonas dyei]
MKPHTMRIALLLLLLLALLPATALARKVHDGDLLFVTAARTGLSGAIDDATATQGEPSFDHVALVAHAGNTGVVLHSDEQGSREQPLQSFIDEATAKQRQIVVYRLTPAHRPAIADAIAQARRMLGKPYNQTYVQDDNRYYCSDFIERAFRAHQVFALQPMNFKNLQTGNVSPYWTDFYRSRGMAVPQGLPGTNPNDMAKAAALRIVGPLN